MEPAKVSLSPIRVTKEKLESAEYLYQRSRGWVLIDSALDHMRESDRTNTDLPTVDAKVITLNTLYRTRLLATNQMAKHIVSIMSDSKLDGSQLVEAMAKVRLKGKTKRLVALASKYCHFFVSPKDFCVFDRYNVRALKRHLAEPRFTLRALSGDYGTFLQGLRLLLERDTVHASWRELDHYLYLWSLRQAYQNSKTRKEIAGGIKSLFESSAQDRSVKRAVETLEGH